jgi:hypothetical protein
VVTNLVLNDSSKESEIIDNDDRPEMLRARIGGGIFLFILSIILGLILSYYTDPRLLLLMSMIGLAVFIGVLYIQFEDRPKAIQLTDEGVIFIFRIRGQRLIKWEGIKGFVIESPSGRGRPFSYGILLDMKKRHYRLNQKTAEAIDAGYLERFGTHPPFDKDVYSGPFLGMQAK